MTKKGFTIKLSNIAFVLQGQSPESKYYSDSDGVPFLQGNRTFGNLYPTFDTYTKKVTKLAKKGDILMSVRAPVGALNFAPCDLCIGRGLASMTAKNGNNDFIYYALKYNIGNLIKQGSATTFDSVNKDILNDFELIIPENENERNSVASVLSTLDAKIELNYRINAELDANARTIYDYWFVQYDFPDENGKPYKSSGGKMIWNEELRKEIPEKWIVDNLSKLFLINPTERLSKGLEYGYIDMNALPENGYITKRVQLKKYKGGMKFRNNDILVARITPCLENGKTALVTLLKVDEIAFGSTEFIVLRGQVAINYAYGACLARSKEFRHFAISKMTGTSGRKRVRPESISGYRLPIPPDAILAKFESTIGRCFELMSHNAKENEEISSFRDWLLPMLMNGQIKIDN